MTRTTPAPHFATGDSLPLWLVTAEGDGPALPLGLSDGAADWAKASGFTGAAGQVCLLPGDKEGGIAGALFGLGKAEGRERFALARAAEALPARNWHIEGEVSDEAALGWLLGQYNFTRYKGTDKPRAQLVAPKGVDAARLETIAAGEFLTRDLINTPANDMGPDELEAAAHALATAHGATLQVISNEVHLSRDFPLIHAVGRASPRRPRLIDLRFGSEGPALTLVGKGVCFDTGGLNLKTGPLMGLMKKDMGGAATVLGLAQMLMELRPKLRLRVLIPAVENAVDGNAIRPGDIFKSRKGLTVEINNTDAEGRLVLADALAYGAEESPDLLVSMATLTGAARVALGPDLPPFYCDDDATAQAIYEAGQKVADPVWRMPFWQPYEKMIEPGVADLDNAPSGGFADSITAALFLRRFAGAGRYAHFDIYGWQPVAAPGRPKGGVGQGARALLAALPKVL